MHQGGDGIKNDMAVGICLTSRPWIQKCILQEDFDANFKKSIGEEKEMFENGSGLAQEMNNCYCESFLSVTICFFSLYRCLEEEYPETPVRGLSNNQILIERNLYK